MKRRRRHYIDGEGGMNKPTVTSKYPDARVQFADDGKDGATFIRYNGCLMTWPEFVDECIESGLAPEFAQEYVMALHLEVI